MSDDLTNTLVVRSPQNYQVFQRRTRLEGLILLSGRVNAGDCEGVEWRATGESLKGALPGDWQKIPFDKATGCFGAQVAVAAGGWYKAEFRALRAGKPAAVAEVEKFGVGEVFVGAGQSNSTNCGDTRTRQNSGMVSAFGWLRWQLADDPAPGCHDNSQGGSFWPHFGDALYAKYKVPIGVAATGHGGSSVTQWNPGGELFNWMMTRIHQLGPMGFRAVLWHQGESDIERPSEEYYARMAELISASKEAAGWEFPWSVALVSYHNPKAVSFESTRQAQKRLWDEGVALEGPDTDTLTGDHRDAGGEGIHFSPKGLVAHGRMWAEKMGAWLGEE
ncbi:MAG: hypothetical protein NTX50_18310 [Candidatus Sumerlaeota bacterium]|nr:hypothetical protein [Candidatus Sumerlaeota bacterium]